MNAPALRATAAALVALAIAFPPQAFAMGPFERNHPAVEQGIDAYQDGRYEEALTAFEDAKKAMPDKAAVEFNRGNALYKLGRMDEARQAYQRAVELDRSGELHQKDYYNLGNAWAAMGNDAEAKAAYRRALTLNPDDELARHNLEVLLRKLPPPPDPAMDGGTDGGDDGGADAGNPDAGPDGGSDGGTDGGMDGGADAGAAPDGGEDGGAPDAGQGDGGQGDGGQGDGGTDGGQSRGDDERRDGGEGEADGQEDGGSPDDDEAEDTKLEEGDDTDAGVGLNPEDVERILDAMQENEKNLQLWRFQQKKKQRRPNEKDW